ncbi:hypothetical protein CDAR_44721 [Caerostris darwini]|uniref:Protein kinase domain-containing protein n=1 Tax=Caerostris darwini TaxID=1538125 RepID=A0AAV4SSB4_9ARAC|nr:hypothetical protein CDAR_44721 [Caerostris darwini]
MVLGFLYFVYKGFKSFIKQDMANAKEETSKIRTPLVDLQLSDFEDSPDKARSHLHLIKQVNALHLSPYEIGTTRRNIAREFKLTPQPKDSFLHNQSFPNVYKSPENGNASFDMDKTYKHPISEFSGLLSCVFSPLKTSPQKAIKPHKNRHLNGSVLLYEDIDSSAGNISLYMQNPTTAIVTINAKTTEVLIANKLAAQYLGIKDNYDSVKLSKFLNAPIEDYLFSETDKFNEEKVLFSGKVMDLVTSSKGVIPVSVWARSVASESDYRCLVVMEPVERITGIVRFNCKGKIVAVDHSFVSIFGYSDHEDVMDLNITDLIPNVKYGSEIPESLQSISNQCITGRTKDQFIFPLSIEVAPCSEEESDSGEQFYEGIIWVFNNISGLITLLPDGTLHNCNANFSLLFFGYSQEELIGKNISCIIPSFYDEYEYLDTESMPLPLFDDDEDSNAKCGASDGRTTADSLGTDIPRPANPIGLSPNRRDDCDSYQGNSSYSTFGDDQSTSSSHFSEQHSPKNHSSQQLDSSHLDTSPPSPSSEEKPLDDSNSLKNEFSASSSYHSRQLSCSESQDTLHSGTNSITGSDINANFYGTNESKVSLRTENENPSEYSYDSSEESSGEQDSASDSEWEGYSEDGKDSLCSKDEDFGKGEIEPFLVPSIVSSSDMNSLSNQIHVRSRSISESGLKSVSLVTKISTPKEGNFRPLSNNSFRSICEGEFLGLGRHRDGTSIAILYFIKKVTLEDGKCVYCLWVTRDPEEVKESSPLAKKSRENISEENESCGTKTETEPESSASSDSEFPELTEQEYIEGSFSEKYSILKHLRNGAFGCIKMAFRKTDGLLVVTKFLRKEDITDDYMEMDNLTGQQIPREVAILTSLCHPNIVKIVDMFENKLCYQMVMEKHGNCMDLFEFIDRYEELEEPLGSYIFRQMVSALKYLHGLGVLHRDIKDENMIIDEKFQVKLIDFGSAVYMRGELFSTFCGTTEYCGPEVVRGHKYRGPELEIFALGVTLYTLMAKENPFIGANEILNGEYNIPESWSSDLVQMIAQMLEPEPEDRCTLQDLEKNRWVIQPVDIQKYKFEEVIQNCTLADLRPVKYYINLPQIYTNIESSSTPDLSCQLSSLQLNDENQPPSEK